jgi:GNAT superfamily N-acetyltransferase
MGSSGKGEVTMKIRDFLQSDEKEYIRMYLDFFQGEAVLFQNSEKNFKNTFEEIMESSPFARGLILEEEGKAAGYALLSFTWSNESGGKVVWLEELYVKEEYRGRKYAAQFMEWFLAE